MTTKEVNNYHYRHADLNQLPSRIFFHQHHGIGINVAVCVEVRQVNVERCSTNIKPGCSPHHLYLWQGSPSNEQIDLLHAQNIHRHTVACLVKTQLILKVTQKAVEPQQICLLWICWRRCRLQSCTSFNPFSIVHICMIGNYKFIHDFCTGKVEYHSTCSHQSEGSAR